MKKRFSEEQIIGFLKDADAGAQIKVILEDVADNLFNADPYYQQGGDMVRVGGLAYAIEPTAACR